MAIFDRLNPLRIPDFNGDGRTDLFGFDAAQRTPQITLLSGVRSIGSSAFAFQLDGWQDPKLGDFNGDGKTDVLWQNSVIQKNAILLMNGAAVQEEAYLDPLPGTWSNIVGDFNGDGKSDIAWYNPNTGDFQLWAMDGTKRIQTFSIYIGLGWSPTLASFNTENRTDLFWRNSITEQNAAWTFDPKTLEIRGEFVESKPLTWTAELIDYNGDGISDVFWRDRLTGQNQIWLWTPGTLQPNPTPIHLPATGSDIVFKIADFEGDGKTDFLVRDPSTGANQVWLAGDLEVRISDIAPQPPGFQANIGDYNGDRFSDIRWVSTDGTQSVIWFSDGIFPRPML